MPSSGRLSAFVALSSVAALAFSVQGCSSAPDAPPPLTGQAGALSSDPELAALEIGADELVGDELGSDAEVDTIAYPEGSEVQEDGTFPDDLLDQSPMDPSISDELPNPPPGLGEETGPEFSSLSFKEQPIGVAREWWSKSYECARNPLRAKCACRGSTYNCQFPNIQPGRNRYLPPRPFAHFGP